MFSSMKQQLKQLQRWLKHHLECQNVFQDFHKRVFERLSAVFSVNLEIRTSLKSEEKVF